MGAILTAARRGATALLDAFFPRRCVYCGAANNSGKYDFVCEGCERDIYIIKGGRCLRCSEIIGPNDSPNSAFCPKCAKDPPSFNWSMACCVFSGPARELALGLKYRSSPHLASDIAKIMKETPKLGEFLKDSVLIPVPLHFARKMKRGYNQSEIIANAAIRAFPNSGITISNALRRTKRTDTQTHLTKEERLENIKGAFKANNRKASKIPKGAHIVIVDDVMTSGATMSECARVLKKLGFKNIDAFAFARKM